MNGVHHLIGDLAWKILTTACQKAVTWFNLANLHYDWSTEVQTDGRRRLWYAPLRELVRQGFLDAYIDLYFSVRGEPRTYRCVMQRVRAADFRRRMSFHVTPKGRAVRRRLLR